MCDPGLALPAWLAADEWRAAVCMDHGSGMGCDQPSCRAVIIVCRLHATQRGHGARRRPAPRAAHQGSSGRASGRRRRRRMTTRCATGVLLVCMSDSVASCTSQVHTNTAVRYVVRVTRSGGAEYA
jgi:hypothetical protein